MITKYQIITALLTGGPPQTTTVHFAIVNGLDREDGSNRSYLVTGIARDTQKTETVHVRTID